MARDILGQICGFLEAKDAELQCAAARVLGALKTDDPGVREALRQAARSPNQMVAAYAIDALAARGGVDDLPHLVGAFGAPHTARIRAIAAVAAAGSAALPVLREGLRSKDVAVRRGVLEAFSRLPGPEALDAFLEAVFDPDEETVRLAVDFARQRIAGLEEKERLALLARLRAILRKAHPAKAPAALAALMKLLGFLRRPEAIPDLLAGLGPKMPPAVRKNAIVSVQHLDLSRSDAKAVASAVLPLLADSDWANLVAPALTVLQRIEVPKALAAKVKALRESPNPAVRLFATRALGTTGTAQACDALLAALAGADPREREAAAAALRQNPAYVPRLAAELEKAKDPAYAWLLAGILKACRSSVPKPTARRLLGLGLKRLAKGQEEQARGFLEVARYAAPQAARDALYEAGAALLRKGKPEAAEAYLRHLERDELVTPEGLAALAVSRLLRSGISLDTAARGANPGVPLFLRLARRGDAPAAKTVRPWCRVLGPGGLLYLGFHFLEQAGPERAFGAEVLRLLVTAFPGSDEAKAARQRLGKEKA